MTHLATSTLRGHTILVAILALVSACESPPTQFVGVGDVVAIDADDHQVTIRHDAIAGFAEAATTRFAAAEAAVQSAVTAGQRVRFVLRQEAGRIVVTTMTLLDQGNPGVHDHTPHHGGVVAMLGMTHLEARADRDGRIRVYLTDRWRRPLALTGVTGTVTLTLADGKRTLPLRADTEALEADGPPLTTQEVNAEVQVVRAGETLEMAFQLPLTPTQIGAAGIPVDGCIPPVQASAGARGPACTMSFRRPIAILAAPADGSRVLAAGVDIGVSAWAIASKQLLVGFAPAPAVALTQPEAPHLEVANAVAVRPDGVQAVVALENRLVFYDIGSGRIVESRSGPGGIVRSVAWLQSGQALLVTVFYDARAHEIRAADGVELRSVSVEREAAAVAVADDGRIFAVGSELGPISLFDSQSGTRIRVLAEPRALVRALAFVGNTLVAAGDDSVLRLWDLTSDAPSVELASASPITQLAPELGGDRVAAAGRDGVIRIYDVLRQTAVDELRWHSASLSAVAWAGKTIVSADVDGRVAFWDTP